MNKYRKNCTKLSPKFSHSFTGPTSRRSQTVDTRKMTGKRGEALAKAFLQQKGWTILATNWRSRIGELDIVATAPDEPYLVIVEVRTKRNNTYGTAAESVNYRKQQKVRRLGLQ